MTEPVFSVRITAIRYEAQEVLSFVLRALDGSDLPSAEPGAHVDVLLPNRMTRSYSLSNGRTDPGSYRLTVARDGASRGGSVYMHDTLRCGQVIEISQPRNNFPLVEDAPFSMFLAGGIGVTPFVPMINRLNERRRKWRLHYSVRTPDRAALLGELSDLASCGLGEILPNFDQVPGGTMLDLRQLVGELPPSGHIYCCGPIGMLNAYRQVTEAAGVDADRVHLEYFSNNVVPANNEDFALVLARSGREIKMRPGMSILQAIRDVGVEVASSCEEGVCGACETRVIEGVPDHRDVILSEKDRREGKTMMICCSGSKSERLVLDL